MIRHIAISIGLVMASKGATVSLQATGTISSPGSFPASAGQSVTLTIQYDDSTVSSELGGVGTVFNSPVAINLLTIDAQWFGTNPAPLDHSIVFNVEAVETTLIFSVPSAGASFGTSPPGLSPVAMMLEISGFSPWFSGSQLADLASADFTAAESATFTLSGGGGSTPLVAGMNLGSFEVVPEPGTAFLFMLGATTLFRRKRGHQLN